MDFDHSIATTKKSRFWENVHVYLNISLLTIIFVNVIDLHIHYG